MAYHVLAGPDDRIAQPAVRKIGVSDLGIVLRAGLDDFLQKPSHYVFLCLIYPIVGVLLALWTTNSNLFPVLYPLMAGFALLGPLAAIGLYEISRRREKGLDTSWKHALAVRRSPAVPAIIAVAVWLFAVFYLWLASAETLYQGLMGFAAPTDLWGFLPRVFTTPEGWELLIWGNIIGFCFAVVTLSTTVVAFPLLIDRDVGAFAAVSTSLRAFAANPLVMLLWGLIVAVALLVGSIPLFIGLAVVIPILGHATWHLYRKVVV